MCTIDEIKDLIHEELFNPKEDGRSRLSREIESHIDHKLNELFWRLMRWMGSSLVLMLVGGTAMWVNISNQVDQNTEFRTQGDRFTKSDGELLQQQIFQLQREQDSFEAWLIRIEAKLDAALK